MLIVFAGSPVTAPLETSLSEKTETEVLVVYLVGEIPRAVTIGLASGGLNEKRATGRVPMCRARCCCHSLSTLGITVRRKW
jgi:hypothetical protein